MQNLVTQFFYYGTENNLSEKDHEAVHTMVESAGLQSEFCFYLEHTGLYKRAGLQKPVFKNFKCETKLHAPDFFNKMSISYERVRGFQFKFYLYSIPSVAGLFCTFCIF